MELEGGVLYCQDERVALLRRGERRSSLFQTTLIQPPPLPTYAAAAAAGGGGVGNPHILISDASSLYSVEELPDELSWSLRRPSTQSVGAVIVAVCVHFTIVSNTSTIFGTVQITVRPMIIIYITLHDISQEPRRRQTFVYLSHSCSRWRDVSTLESLPFIIPSTSSCSLFWFTSSPNHMRIT